MVEVPNAQEWYKMVQAKQMAEAPELSEIMLEKCVQAILSTITNPQRVTVDDVSPTDNPFADKLVEIKLNEAGWDVEWHNSWVWLKPR